MKVEITKPFINKIKQVRSEKGLTQSDVADALEISRQTYIRIETGTNKFIDKVLYDSILSYFDLSADMIERKSQSHQVHLRIPRDTKIKLDQIAIAKGLSSINEVINYILNAYLEDYFLNLVKYDIHDIFVETINETFISTINKLQMEHLIGEEVIAMLNEQYSHLSNDDLSRLKTEAEASVNRKSHAKV